MGIHNPIPQSLKSESRKAASILESFINPNKALNLSDVIPRSVLQNAHGFAIVTVLKAGFLFSGRMGSGIVIARLADGSWSAPSAIGLIGAGAGGQVGAELTDFVFVLNTPAAVRTFASMESITLGGNISFAVGPLGRNAEASASASFKGVSAVFAYSKTKGLFAGVSIEGSVLVERRMANRKFYGSGVKAEQILTGQVPPPSTAKRLYEVLNSPVFALGRGGNSAMYNESPVYGDEFENDYDDDDNERMGSRSARSRNSDPPYGSSSRSSSAYRTSKPQLKNYDRYNSEPGKNSKSPFRSNFQDGFRADSGFSDISLDNDTPPPRPTAPKPQYKSKARALFRFEAEQYGDLYFQKGDIIEVIQKSQSVDDWWTGRIGSREGIFPANYVEII